MKANLNSNGMADYFETLAKADKEIDEEASSLVKDVADIVAEEIRARTPVGDASQGDPHPGQLLAHVVSNGPFKDGNVYYAYAEVDMRDREKMLYAVYNEWGTPTVAARPYIRPGIRSGIRRGDALMIERFDEGGFVTIFEMVKTALGSLSPAVPFGLKPYLSTGALPDTFIDYQLIDGRPEDHFDNVEASRNYLVQVSRWCRAGLVSLPNVDGVMIAAGFMRSDEQQLPKDPATGHYGLATDYIILIKQT